MASLTPWSEAPSRGMPARKTRRSADRRPSGARARCARQDGFRQNRDQACFHRSPPNFCALRTLIAYRGYERRARQRRSAVKMVKCAEGARTISAGLTFLMAFACGAMVANLYYAQTLIDQIGPEIGLSKG